MFSGYENKVKFILIFSPWIVFLLWYLKIYHQTQGYKKHLLYFLPDVLVFHLSIRYMINFELAFVKCVKYVSRLNFLPVNIHVFHIRHWKGHSFCVGWCYSFFKDQITHIYVGLFLSSLLHYIDLYVYTFTNTHTVLFMVDL